MASDPGDLVLDPTCGSGTTAYVAEQWGRRWITIDTVSRGAGAGAHADHGGALSLLPARRLAAKASSRGSRASPQARRHDRVHRGDIRQGFVYERVPHITLKSIANNAEIDVIWEKWQATLGAAARSAQRRCEEDLGRVGDSARGRRASGRRQKTPTRNGGRARIARQKEIDASIAAQGGRSSISTTSPIPTHARVRVAGPFTVESLSPASRAAVDEDDELIDDDDAAEGRRKRWRRRRRSRLRRR